MNKQHYKREPDFSVYELRLNKNKIALRAESSFDYPASSGFSSVRPGETTARRVIKTIIVHQITQTDIKFLYFIIAFLRISLILWFSN